MQTRKKTKLAESPAGFQNLLENLHEAKEGRTSDCGHPESSTLIDASRKDVGKLLERVGDRQELTRKRKENTSGSKKRKSLIQGENDLFYQRQQSETRLSENFRNLPSCGMEARTNLDSERRRKGKDEGHANGDAAKRTSIEESHESQHVQMESESNMNGDGFDWEDGNIASCEGTMPAHTGRWNGDLTIEVEDDDSSKQAKKRPIRRATARDKEFAELVHKVHLLCLIGRGMLVNSACYDPLIQASLYSIVPPHFLNLANDRKLTANMLSPLVKWFQSTFHVQSSEESSSTQPEESKTFVTKLLHSIESRTGTIEEVAALSVALLRVLGLSTRYVSILDVAPLKPDTESLDASANWNSDTDTESGWSIPHMNTTKTTTASLGQILARCPSQLSPRDIVTEDHGGTESHGGRGFGSTRGGDIGNCFPREKSLETSYTEVESADAASKHTGTGYGNSEVTYSEGQEKGTIKRKGDLEFELELAMALSATAVEAQSNVNNENNIACKERHDTTRIDTPTSTSVRRHDIKKSRLGAQQRNTAVWSRKLVPYLYWAEVYCEGETLTGRWVHVDAANGVIDGEHKVEEAAATCKRPLRYVLAFAGNGAKDVTRRYVSILDVAPLKPDTESLDASANWNSDTDTESGWSIPHMNTTKTTTASLGQILARCPSQLSPRDIVTEDHGGTEGHGGRGFGSTRGGDSGNCFPREKSLETSYTEVESADAASKHTGTGYGNSEVTYSEGQEKGTSKRKGDLEFELELAMALSATAVEAQSNVNNENNIACKERHDTTRIDMPTSTSMRRHDIKNSRLGARQRNTAVWSRKLVPYLYWAEVYCEGETLTGRWVHVDAANGVIDGEHKVEETAAACKRPLRYVLAFAGNGAKDVTRRYASKWSAIAPQRVSSQWWEVTMSPLKELEAAASAEASDMKASQEKRVQPSTLSPGINDQGCSNEVGSEDLVKLEASQICDKSTESDGKRFPKDANCISLETQDYKTTLADRSSLEDMELDTRTFTEPLPTNQQAYRSHHLYVLERWLTKYQTLYPKGPVLGFCAGQPVYPRTCVQSLHTAERWLREGLQIKKGETPAKVVKPSRNLAKECSSSPALLEEDCLEGRSTALFGKWQTETLQLPSAVGGIVPKNERGHVDVWSEKCLPPGTVHLRMQRLVPVAKRLGIDFAQAMVGFEIRNGRSVPIFEGIVICEEFRDAILQAYSEEEESREIEEKKKNERQALSRWNQLLRSIATRIRLQNAYEETYSNTVLSELQAVENIESVAKTSTSASDNAFEERNDARQVNIKEGNTHSLEQQNNDFTNTYETVTDVKSLSTQNHTHIFPTENQSYDEESAIWTKCCPCGFSIQVEEM